MNWLEPSSGSRERRRRRARHPRHGPRPRPARGRRQDGRRRRRRLGHASAAATSRPPPSRGPARCSIADGRPHPRPSTVALSDKAPYRARPAVLRRRGHPPARAAAPSCRPSRSSALGHVGLELARILARHDLELHLVDSRADQLDRGAARGRSTTPWRASTCTTRRVPELVLGQVPARHARARHDPRPRRGRRALRRRAALRAPRVDRPDRLVGEVGRFRQQPCRGEGHARRGVARITTPDRPAGPHRQGARRRSRSAWPPTCCAPSSASRLPASRDAGARQVTALPRRRSSTPRATRSPGASAARRGRTPRSSSTTARSPRAAPSPRCVRDHPDEEVVDLPRGTGAARASSTPTSTTPRSGSSAALGMPLLDWLDAVRPARGGAARPTSTTPARSPTSSSPGWSTAGTTTALVFGSHFAERGRRAVRRGRRGGLRVTSRAGRRATAACREPTAHAPPTAPTTRRWRSPQRWHGVGRTPVCRDAALLLLRERRDARRRARRCSRTSRAPGSPRTSTRTSPRSPRSRGCSPRPTLRRHLRPARARRAASRPGPQRARQRRRARPARRTRRCGGALPDEQLRAGQRPVPAAAPRRARRARRPRLGRRRRHRVLAASRRALQAYFMQQLLGAEGLALTAARPAAPRDPAGALRPRSGRRGR